MVDVDTIKVKLFEIADALIFTVLLLLIAYIGMRTDSLLALPAFVATLFLVYVIPNSEYAKLRHTIGGYAVVLILGTVFWKFRFVPDIGLPAGLFELGILAFIAVLIMVVSGTEHPPAAGLLVWFVLGQVTDIGLLGVVISVVVMLVIQVVVEKLAKRKTSDFGDLGALPDLGKIGS